MQFNGPARVTNGSAYVEFLYQMILSSIVGTISVGDILVFSGGASGEVVHKTGSTYSVAITSTAQPALNDTLYSDGSPAATATVASFDTVPDLTGAGVDAGQFFLRDGEQVAYTVAAKLTTSRLQLTAPYGGPSTSGLDTDGIVHTSRTAFFGLPTFDTRDRGLEAILSEAMRLLDNALQDHETRLTDGSPSA